MDRDIPNFNQLIVNRMQQKNLQRHHQRLQNIRSVHQSRISTSSNKNYRQNKKALQQQQEKKTQIQRDNLILFNKMQKIMKRNDPCNRTSGLVPKTNARTTMELNRIQQQNRTMYERLQKQKPTIDNRKLFQQRKKQENILKFLGKYSSHALQNAQNQSFRISEQGRDRLVSGQTRMSRGDHYLQNIQRQMQLEPRPKVRYQHLEFQQQIDQEQFNAHMNNLDRAKKSNSTAYQTHAANRVDLSNKFDSNPVKSEASSVPRSAKDIILFKTFKQIDGQQYQLKIVRSHFAYEIRATATNEQISNPIKIVINQMQGNELLEQNNYDYNKIVNKVYMIGNNLSLKEGEVAEVEDDSQLPETIKNQVPQKNRPSLGYFNPSHISQQNEEDSYRPGTQTINQISPFRPNNRVDSLGAQVLAEESENVESNQDEESRVRVQQKQVSEKDETAGQPPQDHKPQTSNNKNRQIQVTFNPNLVNKYEQALDQSIS